MEWVLFTFASSISILLSPYKNILLISVLYYIILRCLSIALFDMRVCLIARRDICIFILAPTSFPDFVFGSTIRPSIFPLFTHFPLFSGSWNFYTNSGVSLPLFWISIKPFGQFANRSLFNVTYPYSKISGDIFS